MPKTTADTTLTIYTDGASRGNPGDSAWGFIIMDDSGKILYKNAQYLGKNTNNVAEYTALIKALECAREFKPFKITVYSDSEVMVKQLNGQYKVTMPHLQRLNDDVNKLAKRFKVIHFINVSRTHEMIRMTDAMVNECLDQTLDRKITMGTIRDA